MHTARLLDSQVGPRVASESWGCLGPAEFENCVCLGTATNLNRRPENRESEKLEIFTRRILMGSAADTLKPRAKEARNRMDHLEVLPEKVSRLREEIAEIQHLNNRHRLYGRARTEARTSIMDVSMPNMNGLDATRIILREVRESRILIISQNDPAIVQRQATEAHAHGFIEKSNIQRDLISAVECILSGDGQSKIEKAS